MNTLTRIAPRPQSTGWRIFAAACALLMPLLSPAQNAATSPAEAFRRMNADNWIPRSVTLAELGFTTPVVLGYPYSIK